jgi:hypothetical protein
MAIVIATNATERATIPTKRLVRGTGGDLGERFGVQAAQMLGAAEHRSERIR